MNELRNAEYPKPYHVLEMLSVINVVGVYLISIMANKI